MFPRYGSPSATPMMMTNVNTVDIIELELGTRHVPFNEVLNLQRSIHLDVVNGVRDSTIVLVEHDPIYTIGVRSRENELPSPHLPQARVDRGGKVTWHGPGQLVAYPIVALPKPLDVIAYIRALELAVVQTCLDFEVAAEQIDGRSGVWIRNTSHGSLTWATAKVCAIGARISQGVSLHGLALNCSNSLEPFAEIIPCGITDAGVTTLSRIAEMEVTPQAAADSLVHNLSACLTELGIQ